MAPRPCIDCGTPANATRCPRCQATRDRARNTTRPHYQGDWPTLSKRIRDNHVAQYGWVCPGWHTPPHPSTDLVVDHITARSRQALQVLCRPCNSRKSATERTQPPR